MLNDGSEGVVASFADKLGVPSDMKFTDNSMELQQALIFFGGEAFCLLCAILYYKYCPPSKVSPTLRHAIAMVIGILVGIFSFGMQFTHVVVESSACYLAMIVLPQSVMPLGVFIIAMSYLVCLHLYRAYMIPEDVLYSIDVSGNVDVEVFVNLSEIEAMFVSSWHNTRCQQKPMTFQDKVRVARKIFLNGENNWKDEAVVALGDLERKTYTKQGLSTVFSVASYSYDNWETTERLFKAAGDSYTSFPQNIFRQLQSVDDAQRTTYLTRAVGTNGIKTARQVADDKRKDHMRQLAVATLQEDSWEEICSTYIQAGKMLEYNGDLSTPEGRSRYAKYVQELAKNDDETWTINITAKKNGKEIKIEEHIINKFSQKIIKLIKKSKPSEACANEE